MEKKTCGVFGDQVVGGEALLGVDRNSMSPTWAL
jgi:hypothetical protein